MTKGVPSPPILLHWFSGFLSRHTFLTQLARRSGMCQTMGTPKTRLAFFRFLNPPRKEEQTQIGCLGNRRGKKEQRRLAFFSLNNTNKVLRAINPHPPQNKSAHTHTAPPTPHQPTHPPTHPKPETRPPPLVEAPAAEELKRLFDKHDVTGSGNLERQEATAPRGAVGEKRSEPGGSKELNRPQRSPPPPGYFPARWSAG